MSFFKKIIHELNYLKPEDFGQIFVFLIIIIPSLIYKIYVLLFKKDIWLVCEDKLEARDNGYWFFKHLNESHKEIKSYYAISKKSKDYYKVNKVGKTIRYGGFKHWILYFGCNHVISSQKAGKPNAAICYVLEVFGIIKSKFVFLQHGITINNVTWLYYKNTKMRLFICGAKPEYDYVKSNFGYPDNNVKYLGFSRFDNYHNIKVNKKQIILMPSWREWIASKNEYSKEFEDTSDFRNTEYYQKYQELITNKDLISFLEGKNLTLYFYPHRNMQKYINYFKTKSKNIKIVDNNNSDIKDLLINSAVMITDYSSVSFDFAYMKKPVIYFQFDEERFRKAQYGKGYFDYRKNGFGNVFKSSNEVVKELKKIYKNNCEMGKKFENIHKHFFPLYDDKNNERIYEEIRKL